MKLALISPELQDSCYSFSKKEVRSFWFPRLSLTTLAAHTPRDIEVRIIDEGVEKIDFDMDVDLVGISAMTFLSPRAYEISDIFRKRGVKVVLGGIHPTAMPEEAKEHADAVVIGEAEEIWLTLLDDFKKGKLKPFYKMDNLPSLDGLPPQRLELLKPGAYMTNNCLQASRGCPYGCDFCSVTNFFGNTFRLRPVKDVVEEIAALDGKFVVFVDDNIAGNKAYARELFKALIPLKKQWGSQASITLARDPELLELAAKSGCTSLFVGIESVSQETLASANKSFNKVSDYEKSIKMFHDHGILINAGMIFGFDNDDETVFERTVDFLQRNRVGLVLFSILTPFPGTGFYKRLESEGRIIDKNWSHYDGRNVVFKPKNLSPEALQDGFHWAYHKFYSIPSILNRILPTKQNRIARLYFNWAYRRMVIRVPKGGISPLSPILNRLQGKLPVFETKNLIPNTIHTIKEKVGEVSGQIESFLEIRVKKNERLQAILIELEGTLDRINASELKKRIVKTAQKTGMDIIINLKHLKEATPAALNILFSERLKIADSLKVKLLNLSDSFKEKLENLHPAYIIIEEKDLTY